MRVAVADILIWLVMAEHHAFLHPKWRLHYGNLVLASKLVLNISQVTDRLDFQEYYRRFFYLYFALYLTE